MTREQPVASGGDLSDPPVSCPFLFRAGHCSFHNLIISEQPAPPDPPTTLYPSQIPFLEALPPRTQAGRGTGPGPSQPPPLSEPDTHAHCLPCLEVQVGSGSCPGLTSGSLPTTQA